MGKLIEDMSKAGVLLSFAGCEESATGARVSIDGGKFTVTDGPFPETKELIAGFCMLQVKTKAEALEWTKRFLPWSAKAEAKSVCFTTCPPAERPTRTRARLWARVRGPRPCLRAASKLL